MRKFSVILISLILAFSLVLPRLSNNAQAEIISSPNSLSLIDEVKGEYGFSSADEFLLDKTVEIEYGKVYKFLQIYGGVKVYDRGINLTVDKDGNLLSHNGNYLKINSISRAVVSEREANELVASLNAGEVIATEKVIYSLGDYENSPIYAYNITLSGGTALISASDGSVINFDADARGVTQLTTQTDYFNNEVETYVEKTHDSRNNTDTYELADYTKNIFAVDMNYTTATEHMNPMTSNTEKFDDKMAISAYNNVVKAYDFYTDKNNVGVARYGLNGKNDEISGNCTSTMNEEIGLYVLVHYGRSYNNAYYSPNGDSTKTSVMIVGDGSSNAKLYHQGAALDILAHEYQHGVTSFIAGLNYQNDSGAIDEATSDIFGMLIEGHEIGDEKFWLIGEDGVSSKYSCVRSTINPSEKDYSNVNYHDKTSPCNQNHNHENYNCDRGGVHDNSTILTHMQYNIYKDMPDVFNTRVIGRLWFNTVSKLTKNATFNEFGETMIATATEMELPDEAIEVIEKNLYLSGITAPSDTHLVTFLNPDNSIIDKFSVEDGGTAPTPTNPYYKCSDSTKMNVVDSYSGSLENVTENRTIKVTYKQVPKVCTVRYFDGDNKLVKKFEVGYGETITPPAGVEKEMSEGIAYEFAGWDKEISVVTEDVEVYATFNEVKTHLVKFMVDGKVYNEQYVKDGGSAIAPEDPVKEQTRYKVYEFAGWGGSLDNIKTDKVFIAVFNETERLYKVKFVSDGKEIHSYEVAYASPLVFPDEPTKEGYEFGGWFFDEQFTSPASETDFIYDEQTFYAKWNEPVVEPPAETPPEDGNGDVDNDNDKKSGCFGAGTISLNNMLPPAALLLILSAVIIFVPKKRKNRIK